VLKIDQVSKGGISGTVTDVRIILKTAILNTASGLVVAHNHPSGNMSPSEADIKITRKIKEAGSLMDV
jgi:DNA repair protein RadC